MVRPEALEVMPRRPREEEAGAIHHVFARGDDRRPVFLDDADHRLYLLLLGRTVAQRGWAVLAYCLMGNHLHLLVETPRPDLGAGMQRLQSVFAQTVNARHGRVGHVFQGRYGGVRVRSDAQLWSVTSYIACNPVVAGLCAEPWAWPWSSDGEIRQRRERPAWLAAERLLELLSGAGGDPRRRYEALVSEGIEEARRRASAGSSGTAPAAAPAR